MTPGEAFLLLVGALVTAAVIFVLAYRTGYANGQIDGWHKRDRAQGVRGFFEPWW